MRTTARTSAVWLASLLALYAGCAADNPAEVSLGRDFGPDAGPRGDDVMPGPVALEIDSSLTTTPWDAVPVTGRGPANGLLVFGVPALGQDTYPLGSTGEFCVDVALLDGDNTIRFEAISADGEHSDPVLVQVRKEGTPPDPEPVDTGGVQLADRTAGTSYLGNYYIDALGFHHPDLVQVEQGSFAELVDGNKSKPVLFSDAGVQDGSVVAFSLPQSMNLYSFDITVPAKEGDTCAPEGYEIWVSNDPNPELALDGVHWYKLAERTAAQTQSTGTTYHDAITLPGFPGHHFALRMTDSSCVKWFTTDPRTVFGINEIRVIAAESQEDVPPPSDGSPSCARGNF